MTARIGDNTGIPAFRWCDKPAGKAMATSNLETTSNIEHRLSTGAGLLARSGASRWTIFSGDADDCLCTYSADHDGKRITFPGVRRVLHETLLLRTDPGPVRWRCRL